MATGLVAAAAAPALAASGDSTLGSGLQPAQTVKRDPVTQYPKAPFLRQVQPAPGLASRMVPRPDHGERSYKGTRRLVGRKVLITGGDSCIGRAAAIAFAREGADVVIGYLPEEESGAREVVVSEE